jgi:hypothetical protein
VFGGFGSVGRGGVGGGSGVPGGVGVGGFGGVGSGSFGRGGVGVVCIRIPVITLLFSEITVVLVRFKHTPSFIVNANPEWVRAGVRLRLTPAAAASTKPPLRPNGNTFEIRSNVRWCLDGRIS